MMKINEEEFYRLQKLEQANAENWNLRNNLIVHPAINDCFEENNWIRRIIFDEGYTILKDKHQNNGNYHESCIGELTSSDFDHFYGVKFKDDICRIEATDTITGIMNFPYMNWRQAGEFVEKTPYNWETYIINPTLMNYGGKYVSAIGLFLTPKYYDGYYIQACNNLMKKLTGYELFLQYTTEDVQSIECEYPDCSKKAYVQYLKNYSDNKCLSKLLDFWYNNHCVIVDSFEYSYADFSDNQSFEVWKNINFKNVKSTIPFRVINHNNNDCLGIFTRFHLDKSYNIIDTDKSPVELSDGQVKDLLDGEYDFELVN